MWDVWSLGPNDLEPEVEAGACRIKNDSLSPLRADSVGSACLLGTFFPELILGVFIHDPKTLQLGVVPLQLNGLTLWFEVVGLVFVNALNGTGATKIVMNVSIGLQWLLLLPAVFIVGPILGFGLTPIWVIDICYQFLFFVVFLFIWKNGSWTRIKL